MQRKIEIQIAPGFVDYYLPFLDCLLELFFALDGGIWVIFFAEPEKQRVMREITSVLLFCDTLTCLHFHSRVVIM